MYRNFGICILQNNTDVNGIKFFISWHHRWNTSQQYIKSIQNLSFGPFSKKNGFWRVRLSKEGWSMTWIKCSAWFERNPLKRLVWGSGYDVLLRSRKFMPRFVNCLLRLLRQFFYWQFRIYTITGTHTKRQTTYQIIDRVNALNRGFLSKVMRKLVPNWKILLTVESAAFCKARGENAVG